jgi:hypothetical protein
VPGAVVGGFLDPVGVMPSPFHDARVGAVPAPGLRFFALVMSAVTWARRTAAWSGGKAGPTARQTIRRVRVNLTRSGLMPAAVAAAQVRALIAQWVSR